ncbi:MAG: gamma-glutamyltransferase [Candidatus Latescibacteria bacterium]|nr:gamma-glutamyltransferase [Candidatus Latescibacterota bacterium]
MSSPHGLTGTAHRPVIMGRTGMVASGHPLASQAGLRILLQGGNAIDAAIATAAALNVVEPNMSGMGGDGFIMVYRAQTGEIKVVNATGPAPRAAWRELFLPDGIPAKGILTVSVPGLIDGWCVAHEQYGVLPLSTVLEPAIDLAEHGFPISHKLGRAIVDEPPTLTTFPTSRAVYTRDGRPLGAGEVLIQAALADSFRALGREGSETFYRGEIAREIVRFSEQHGGLLSAQDFADYHARWEEPISTTYRGHRVYEAPPNSSGHVLLQELNIVEQFDLQALGCNTAAAVHLMVEAKRLAFADREAYMADPDWIDVPTAGLLAKAYAAERGRLIDLDRAMPAVEAGRPDGWERTRRSFAARHSEPHEDTTCFCVVDRWGNAVCQLQSIQMSFGSGLIAGNTGILLNNRMTYWHLEADHVDCLMPGKRVRHTMNPVMVFDDDGMHDRAPLRLVCGTPGADTQVQTNLQVITHVLDFGLTVQEAVEAPRWRHTGNGTESDFPHTCPDELRLEGRFPDEVRAGLASRGHALTILDDWGAMGNAQAIYINPDNGALMGGSDPRRDGYAVGY